MIHYFYKIGLNAPIQVNGQNIQFEQTERNCGVKQLSDENPNQTAELAELNRCADNQARGVSRISLEIYTQKKSNRHLTLSQNQRQSPHGNVRIFDSQSLSLMPARVAEVAKPAAVVEQPTPSISIPVVQTQQPAPFVPNVRRVEVVK